MSNYVPLGSVMVESGRILLADPTSIPRFVSDRFDPTAAPGGFSFSGSAQTALSGGGQLSHDESPIAVVAPTTGDGPVDTYRVVAEDGDFLGVFIDVAGVFDTDANPEALEKFMKINETEYDADDIAEMAEEVADFFDEFISSYGSLPAPVREAALRYLGAA